MKSSSPSPSPASSTIDHDDNCDRSTSKRHPWLIGFWCLSLTIFVCGHDSNASAAFRSTQLRTASGVSAAATTTTVTANGGVPNSLIETDLVTRPTNPDELSSGIPDDNKDEEVEDSNTREVTYYMHARHDRSGRHLVYFMVLDAVVYAHNNRQHDHGQKVLMGGACDGPEEIHMDSWSERKRANFYKYRDTAQSLIRLLGLEDRFQYKCPTPAELKAGSAKMLKGARHMKPVQYFLTSAWHQHFLQQHVHYPYDAVPSSSFFTNNNELSDAGIRVAVHMRRGDVTPCDTRDNVGPRYLPNSYFLHVLDEYLPRYCDGGGTQTKNKCEVTIHSERQSFESFDVFDQRGYQLDLDGDLEGAWKSMINADVLIVSNSAFSFVPAVLNRNVVLYPPMDDGDYAPLPGWTVLPQEYATEAMLERETLLREKCHEN